MAGADGGVTGRLIGVLEGSQWILMGGLGRESQVQVSLFFSFPPGTERAQRMGIALR